jgi:hypothetical protein
MILIFSYNLLLNLFLFFYNLIKSKIFLFIINKMREKWRKKRMRRLKRRRRKMRAKNK